MDSIFLSPSSSFQFPYNSYETTSLEQLESLRESITYKRKELEFKVLLRQRERQYKLEHEKKWSKYQREVSKLQYKKAFTRNKRIIEELKATRLRLKNFDLKGESMPLLMLSNVDENHIEKGGHNFYLGKGINEQLSNAKKQYYSKIETYLPKWQEKLQENFLKKKEQIDQEKREIENQRKRFAEMFVFELDQSKKFNMKRHELELANILMEKEEAERNRLRQNLSSQIQEIDEILQQERSKVQVTPMTSNNNQSDNYVEDNDIQNQNQNQLQRQNQNSLQNVNIDNLHHDETYPNNTLSSSSSNIKIETKIMNILKENLYVASSENDYHSLVRKSDEEDFGNINNFKKLNLNDFSNKNDILSFSKRKDYLEDFKNSAIEVSTRYHQTIKKDLEEEEEEEKEEILISTSQNRVVTPKVNDQATSIASMETTVTTKSENGTSEIEPTTLAKSTSDANFLEEGENEEEKKNNLNDEENDEQGNQDVQIQIEATQRVEKGYVNLNANDEEKSIFEPEDDELKEDISIFSDEVNQGVETDNEEENTILIKNGNVQKDSSSQSEEVNSTEHVISTMISSNNTDTSNNSQMEETTVRHDSKLSIFSVDSNDLSEDDRASTLSGILYTRNRRENENDGLRRKNKKKKVKKKLNAELYGGAGSKGELSPSHSEKYNHLEGDEIISEEDILGINSLDLEEDEI